MTSITNKKDSPLFEDIKIYREELEVLRKVGTHSNMSSYGYYFLQLLSRAVCENVDGYNEIFINGNKPQLYVKIKDLANIFGVKRRKDAVKIVEILRDEFGVLDFAFVGGYMKTQKFYIYFKKVLCSLPKGTYSRKNIEAFNNAMAIKNNEGFFYINKEEFFNVFYKNNRYQKGIQDFYLLIRLNCVYSVDYFSDNVPAQLQNCHIALWRLEYDKTNSENQIEYSLYCRRKPLCDFLRISDKTIQRYSEILSNVNLVQTIYYHHRGNAFLFPLLDAIVEDDEKRDSNNNNDCNTSERKYKKTERKFDKKKISEITMLIKEIIYNFIKAINYYTTYKRKYLFLNIYTKKLSC